MECNKIANPVNPPRLLNWINKHPPAINFAGGALLNLAFAPLDFGVLAWVLLVPLLAAAESPSPGRRTACGLAFGLGLALPGVFWLVTTVHEHVGTGMVIALGSWLLVAAYLSLYPACFAWLAGYPSLARWRWFTWPVLWALLDDLRNQSFGGNPWLHLGYTQVNLPLSGYVPILGATGAGAVVVLLNLALLHSLQARRIGPRVAALAGAASMVLTGLALGAVHWSRPIGAPVPLALLHTATQQADKDDRKSQGLWLSRYIQATKQLIDAGTTLVVWPETASGQLRSAIQPQLDALNEYAVARNASVVMGVLESDPRSRIFNSVITLGEAGGQRYRKHHLVLLGEYVPAWMASKVRWAPGSPRYAEGMGPSVVYAVQTTLGIGVYWEASFARDMRIAATQGANVLFNLANDAWFSDTTLPQRNAVHARMRALELSRPMARAANLGPSLAAGPRGELLAQTSAENWSILHVTVQPQTGQTPFAILGPDGVQLSFAVLLFIGWMAGRRQ